MAEKCIGLLYGSLYTRYLYFAGLILAESVGYEGLILLVLLFIMVVKWRDGGKKIASSYSDVYVVLFAKKLLCLFWGGAWEEYFHPQVCPESR